MERGRPALAAAEVLCRGIPGGGLLHRAETTYTAATRDQDRQGQPRATMCHKRRGTAVGRDSGERVTQTTGIRLVDCGTQEGPWVRTQWTGSMPVPLSQNCQIGCRHGLQLPGRVARPHLYHHLCNRAYSVLCFSCRRSPRQLTAHSQNCVMMSETMLFRNREVTKTKR